jgi:hypothetical protein
MASLAQVRENWSLLVAGASICFGIGGYASGARIGATVEQQRIVLDEAVRTQERIVSIEEHQAHDIDTILEWVRIHDEMQVNQRQRAAALKAAGQGK